MITIIRAFSKSVFLLVEGLASMLMVVAEGWGGCGNFLKEDKSEAYFITGLSLPQIIFHVRCSDSVSPAVGLSELESVSQALLPCCFLNEACVIV